MTEGRTAMNREWLFCLSLAMALSLAGCHSSAEDKVYTVFKCAKVATLLGREADADAALRNGHAQWGTLQVDGSQARYAMLLGQRFQDDVQLHKYQPSSQFELLLELYGAKACQGLYK